jgi:hypothetical protein
LAISELGELCEGAELTVVDFRDLPKRPRVLVHIPDTSEVTTVVTRLRNQNPELNTADWLILSRKVTEKEQNLTFSIDPNSFKALAKSNFTAFWGLGRIIFPTLKEVNKRPEAEGVAGKSSSQEDGLGCPLCCYEELRSRPHTGTLVYIRGKSKV